MNEYLLAAAIILWLAVGFASFVFWWTRLFDFTVKELGVALFSSLLGPFNFYAGWCVFGNSWKFSCRVLFKKRK